MNMKMKIDLYLDAGSIQLLQFMCYCWN